MAFVWLRLKGMDFTIFVCYHIAFHVCCVKVEKRMGFTIYIYYHMTFVGKRLQGDGFHHLRLLSHGVCWVKEEMDITTTFVTKWRLLGEGLKVMDFTNYICDHMAFVYNNCELTCIII